MYASQLPLWVAAIVNLHNRNNFLTPTPCLKHPNVLYYNYTEGSVKRKELPHKKFQYSEKKVKLPGNVHAYAE